MRNQDTTPHHPLFLDEEADFVFLSKGEETETDADFAQHVRDGFEITKGDGSDLQTREPRSLLFDVRTEHLKELSVFQDMLSMGDAVRRKRPRLGEEPTNREETGESVIGLCGNERILLGEDSNTLAFIFASLDRRRKRYWPGWDSIIDVFKAIDKYDCRPAANNIEPLTMSRLYEDGGPTFTTIYAWATHLELEDLRICAARQAAKSFELVDHGSISDGDVPLAYRDLVRFCENFEIMIEVEESEALTGLKAVCKAHINGDLTCQMNTWSRRVREMKEAYSPSTRLAARPCEADGMLE